MLDIHVSHFPVQSARQSVQRLDSAGLPRLAVPKTSFFFENLMCCAPFYLVSFKFSGNTIAAPRGADRPGKKKRRPPQWYTIWKQTPLSALKGPDAIVQHY
jgi:hypothetical protein